MPSREEFLDSYVRRQGSPRGPQPQRQLENLFDSNLEELNTAQQATWDASDWEDVDSIRESRANSRPTPQTASPDIDFKTLASSAQAFAGNPLQAKENVLSEVIGRLDREPANELNRSRETQISSDVLLDAVADRFGLGDSTRGTYFLQNRSPWRWASNFESTHVPPR